ncbi:MAG: hypothetical protein EXX96DRAFT_473231, partial [Benjaminiella poitrasii]
VSAIFLYEDGHGKIYYQSGNDTMDLEGDVNPYHPETLTNIRHYCETQVPEQESLIKDLDTRMEDVTNLVGTVKKQQISYNNYSSEQRHFYYFKNKIK